MYLFVIATRNDIIVQLNLNLKLNLDDIKDYILLKITIFIADRTVMSGL